MDVMGEIEERFNRYIVECKVICRRVCDFCSLDLIDTLWNVKVGAARRRASLEKI